MALSISQIVASSYNAVLADQRKPANQWAESALMRALEKLGAIERKSLGPQIECPIDYARNPGAAFLATDLEDTGTTKSDVISTAVYDIAQLSVPIVWSKADEAKNPTENQKISLVASLIKNAIDSHDDLIEQALFSTITNGFLGFQNLIKNTGSVGSIDGTTEAFWRSQHDTYASNGTDIEAALTTVFNACSKGSGSKLSPKLIVSGSEAQALYEAQLQAYQRFGEVSANGGFESLKFKSAGYVFSPYGTSTIYMLNPTSLKLVVSKQMFRSKGEEMEMQNAQGFKCHVFSALQATTNNRSRLGYLTVA